METGPRLVRSANRSVEIIERWCRQPAGGFRDFGMTPKSPHQDRGVPTHSVGRTPKSPHRNRGMPTPSSGGPENHLTEIEECRPPRREGPKITSPKSGNADPLVGRARKSPHRNRGMPTPSSGGPQTASSQVHLARSLPPSMRSAVTVSLSAQPRRLAARPVGVLFETRRCPSEVATSGESARDVCRRPLDHRTTGRAIPGSGAMETGPRLVRSANRSVEIIERWCRQPAGGFRDFGMTFGNPDFAAYAKAYHAKGSQVEPL